MKFKFKINIKRNTYLSNLKRFGVYLKEKFFYFSSKLNYNRFFSFVLKKKNQKFKTLRIALKFFLPHFYLKFNDTLFQKWSFVTGNLIPLFSWQYSNFSINLDLNHLPAVKKNPSRVVPLFSVPTLKKNLKRFFINNFKYFNSIDVFYENLAYLVHSPETNFFSYNVFGFLLEKPYMFSNVASYLPKSEDFFVKNISLTLDYKVYLNLFSKIYKKNNSLRYWHAFWKQQEVKKLYLLKKTRFPNNTRCLFSNFCHKNKKNKNPLNKKTTFISKLNTTSLKISIKRKCLSFTTAISAENSNFSPISGLLFSFILNKATIRMKSLKALQMQNKKTYFQFFWHFLTINSLQTPLFKRFFFSYKNYFRNSFKFKRVKKSVLSPNLLNVLKSKFFFKYYTYFNVFPVESPNLNLYTNNVFIEDFEDIYEAYNKFIEFLNMDFENLLRILPHLNEWKHPSKFKKKKKIRSNFFWQTNKIFYFFFKNKIKQKISLFSNNFQMKRNKSLNVFFKLKKKNTSSLRPSFWNFKTSRLENSKIFKTYSYLTFFSYHGLNFLLFYDGFLYLTNLFLEENLETFDWSDLRKELCTFASKYDIHKLILKGYSQNKDFDLLDSDFILEDDDELILHSNFFNRTPQNLLSKTKSNFYSLKPIALSNMGFSNKIPIAEDQIENFNIKRVKFKPGYRRIWKEARFVFKNSLNLTFKYEYKLTRYLLKFRKFSRLNMNLVFEMRLSNVVAQSGFLYYNEFIVNFIKNNFFYVNGHACSNPHFQLYVNDFVQLVISTNYYITYKFILNFFLKRKIKIKNKIQKKMNLIDDFKPNYKVSFPNALLSETNLDDDAARYLEIDFFTLSIFVIYEPFLFEDFNSYSCYNIKHNILNMYNWKYIT